MNSPMAQETFIKTFTSLNTEDQRKLLKDLLTLSGAKPEDFPDRHYVELPELKVANQELDHNVVMDILKQAARRRVAINVIFISENKYLDFMQWSANNLGSTIAKDILDSGSLVIQRTKGEASVRNYMGLNWIILKDHEFKDILGFNELLAVSAYEGSVSPLKVTLGYVSENYPRKTDLDRSHPIIDKLATLTHTVWSEWMRYQFEKSEKNEDGSVTIPADLVERWTNQMNTFYHNLPHEMQDSDIQIADRCWIEVVQALDESDLKFSRLLTDLTLKKNKNL